MFRPKKKECQSCKKQAFIFSKKLCKFCWTKQHGKPIKKISEKHKQTLKEYKPIREKFLNDFPLCSLNLKGCTKIATCIHHRKSKHSKELYLDSTLWLPSCINCNRVVEEIGAKAYELGLKIRHNEKD